MDESVFEVSSQLQRKRSRAEGHLDLACELISLSHAVPFFI